MGVATSPTIVGGIITSPSFVAGIGTSPMGETETYRFYGVRVPDPPRRFTARQIARFARDVRALLDAFARDPRTASAFVNAVVAEHRAEARRLARKLGLHATLEPADALLALAVVGPSMRPAKTR